MIHQSSAKINWGIVVATAASSAMEKDVGGDKDCAIQMTLTVRRFSLIDKFDS